MSNSGEPLRYYTLEEVADLLHISLISLQRDCRAGRVRHIHLGRQRLMTREQIEALVAQHVETEKTPSASPTDARTARLARQMARSTARRNHR